MLASQYKHHSKYQVCGDFWVCQHTFKCVDLKNDTHGSLCSYECEISVALCPLKSMENFPCLFLACCGSHWTSGFLGLHLIQSLTSLSHSILFVCLCPHFPLLTGYHLFQQPSYETDCICKGPVSNGGESHTPGTRYQCVFGRGHNLTCNMSS